MKLESKTWLAHSPRSRGWQTLQQVTLGAAVALFATQAQGQEKPSAEDGIGEKVLSNDDIERKPIASLKEWYASVHIEGQRKEIAGKLHALSGQYKSPLFAERRKYDSKVIDVVQSARAKVFPTPALWANEFQDPDLDREMRELISKVNDADAFSNPKRTYRVPTGRVTGTVLMDYIRDNTVLPFTLDPAAEKELAATVLNITEDETRMWAVLGEALERSNKLALRSDLFADSLPSLLHIHPGPEHATQHSYAASNEGLWIRRVVRKTDELGQPIFDPEKKEFEQVTSSQNFLLSDWDAKLRNLKIK